MNTLFRYWRGAERRVQSCQCRVKYWHSPKPLAFMNKIYVTLFFDYEGKWSRPDQENSSRIGIAHILGKLDQVGIQATFNCVGRLIEDQQNVLEQINQAGHEIASHTVGHTLVNCWTEAQMALEIEKFKELLYPVTPHIFGFRSPQSRWNFKGLHGLLQADLLWDAANDPASFPYVIAQKGNRRLWRMPTRIDDWNLEKQNLDSHAMLQVWCDVILSAAKRRHYVAIGFHPWVLGKDSSRLDAFSKFIDFLCCQENLIIKPFKDLAQLCESQIKI